MSIRKLTPITISEATVLTTSRDLVGECPVWSVKEQALYWVDIEGRRIHRFDWLTQAQQTWHTPERIACIALTDRLGVPGVVAAMESGIFALNFLAPPELGVKCIASINHPHSNMRFNDGRCDSQGRFWVSTMCMDMSMAAAVGGIFCLDKAGLSPSMIDGLITPNGIAFSPDEATLYFSDSHPAVQKIWAMDVNPATSALRNRREFVDMNNYPGRPDGAAIDVEGCYWICANDAGQIHRFSPQGVLLQSVQIPVAKPSMCCFGGPKLDIIFVASILPAGVPPEQPGLNGALFAMPVGIQGLPEPLFSRFPVSRF